MCHLDIDLLHLLKSSERHSCTSAKATSWIYLDWHVLDSCFSFYRSHLSSVSHSQTLAHALYSSLICFAIEYMFWVLGLFIFFLRSEWKHTHTKTLRTLNAVSANHINFTHSLCHLKTNKRDVSERASEREREKEREKDGTKYTASHFYACSHYHFELKDFYWK